MELKGAFHRSSIPVFRLTDSFIMFMIACYTYWLDQPLPLYDIIEETGAVFKFKLCKTQKKPGKLLSHHVMSLKGQTADMCSLVMIPKLSITMIQKLPITMMSPLPTERHHVLLRYRKDSKGITGRHLSLAF